MAKKFIILGLIGMILMVLVSCQLMEPIVETQTVTVTVVETAVETVEVEKKSPYAYELLLEMAAMDNYIGKPAYGHKIAFANISGDLSYPAMVQESIIAEWKTAGGSEDTIILMDNMKDRDIAMENAEAIIDSEAEVFIQFFYDINTNAHIGKMASEKGLYVIAVEVPVPGFPLMGIDNYSAAVLAGQWAADMVIPAYGSWEMVDRVVYLGPGGPDDRTSLRIYGAKAKLIESFGQEADNEIVGSKAVMVEGVMTSGDAGKAITDILEQYPEEENVIVFCLNDIVAEGVYTAAVESERWDPDKWLVISNGLDDRGKELVSAGVIDADIAFFPERYGDFLVPAVLAHIYGNPIPPYIFMEMEVITSDNIGEYYP